MEKDTLTVMAMTCARTGNLGCGQFDHLKGGVLVVFVVILSVVVNQILHCQSHQTCNDQFHQVMIFGATIPSFCSTQILCKPIQGLQTMRRIEKGIPSCAFEFPNRKRIGQHLPLLAPDCHSHRPERTSLVVGGGFVRCRHCTTICHGHYSGISSMH